MSVWRAPLLALALAATGCGQEQILVPTRNLDRPVAVAFACLKLDSALDPYEPATPGDCDTDDGTRRLYGFVADSTRGEVAIVDATGERLVDLEPALPGFQFVPVGALPSDAAATPDGCRVATANYGSCDFSLVDTVTAAGGASDVPMTWRTRPVAGSTEIRARPHSLVVRPGTAFEACPVGAPYEAYVTFPGCGLVARVDLASGDVREALRIGTDRVERVADIADLACPDECGAGEAARADSARPAGLDLSDDGSKLVVAAEGAPYVAWAELDRATGEFVSFGRIPIEGAAGTRRVSISPTTDAGRFAYAVATDGTVRVLSLALGRECETNVDPRALLEVVPAGDAFCFPVGDPAYPQRPLARGPGIYLGKTGIGGDLAVDVSFGRIRCCPSEPDDDGECPDDPDLAVCLDDPESSEAGEGDGALATVFYDGVYAFVVSTLGAVYVVDVQDDYASARTAGGFRREALPHALRPTFARADHDCDEDENDGVTDFRWKLPFADAPVLQHGDEVIARGDMDYPDVLDVTACPDECSEDEDGACVNPCGQECLWPDDHGLSFPDPRAVEEETIALAFEGGIPGTGRSTGRVGLCNGRPCVADVGAAFCGRGVEDGDVVEMTGCGGDADCDTLIEECAFDPATPPGVGGFCVPADRAEEQVDACLRIVRSRREWRVVEAWDDHLVLDLLPVPLHCEDEAICGECVNPAESNDCLRSCTRATEDVDCPGAVCEQVGGQGVCVAAPPMDPACYATIARYVVRAGGAYRVLYGNDNEFFHRVVPAGDGRCAIDATGAKSPLLVSRIPLSPPGCVDPAGPTPNPCVEQSRTGERYVYFAGPRASFALRRIDRTPVRTPEATFFMQIAVTQPMDTQWQNAGAFQPVRILRGPDGWQYVVDAADSVPAGGVRGQLLRWSALATTTDASFSIR